MEGSPRFSISWGELRQVLWVALLFGLSAALTKLAELGPMIEKAIHLPSPWSEVVPMVLVPALLWLAKRLVTDTETPAMRQMLLKARKF